MNRIYRLVFNRSLRVLQVASEFAGRKHSDSTTSIAKRPLSARRPVFLACAGALSIGLSSAATSASAQPAQITLTHGTASDTSSSINCTAGGCQAPATGPFVDTTTTSGNLTDGTLNTQLAINDTTVMTSADGITSNSDFHVDLQGHTLKLDSATYITLGGTFNGTGHLDLNFATTLDLASTPYFTTGQIVTATGNGQSTMRAVGQTWNLTGANQGTVVGITFSGIANLTDSAGNFNFGTNGSVIGMLAGGGNGTLDYGSYGTAVNVDLGGSATSTGGWTGISTVMGSSASDTISGINQTYNLTGANAGNSGAISWTSFENLSDSTAGSFVFADGANVTGSVNGGGAGTLDYSAYSMPVNVNLSNAGTTGIGGTIHGISTVKASTNLTVSGTTAGPLTVTTAGVGTLGATTIGGDLNVSANGGITLIDDVTTAGSQSYHSSVTLGSEATLTATQVNLASSLTGGGYGLTIVGNATLSDASALSTLQVGGQASLNGNITTTGTQTYTGAVALGNNATLSSSGSGTVRFGSAVDGAYNLTVNTGGLASFGAAIGGATALHSLAVSTGTFDAKALTIGTGGLSLTTSAGALTQGGSWMVVGTSTFNAGNHAITLDDAGNNFTGAVSLRNSGAHDVTLGNGGNALTLGAIAIGSGVLSVTNYGSSPLQLTQDITTQGGVVDFGSDVTLAAPSITIDTTGSGNVAGANISLGGAVGGAVDGANSLTLKAGTGAVAIAGAVGGGVQLGDFTSNSNTFSAGSTLNVNGDLSITTTGGAIGQNDRWVVGGTSSFDAGTGAITLTNAGNQFSGLVSATGTGVSLSAANDLTVAALTDYADGDISLIAGGTLTLPASAISAGNGNLTLASNGGVLTIGSSLSGSNINLTGTNGLSLGGNTSALGLLTLVSGGGSINAAGVLTAGTLTGSSTGDTLLTGLNQISTLGAFSAANFSLTNAHALTVSGPLTTSGGTGNIGLTTTSGSLSVNTDLAGGSVSLNSAGNLTLTNNITATTAELTSSGNIAQSGGSLIIGTLAGSSVGSTMLTGMNLIGALGNFTANGFSLTSAKSLTIATGATVNGGSSTQLATTAGDLIINGTVQGTTTTLNSAGAISEGASGNIVAGTLTGSSVGSTTLNGANHIGTLGSFSAANFALTNAQALAVSGPLMTTGGTGNISLTTTSGSLSVNTDLAGGSVALNSAGDLALTNNITATTAELTSGGAISQSSGLLTVATLSGGSVGNTTLTGMNLIGTLSNFSAANFALTNAQALSISGTLSATNITLNASAGIVVTGAINAAGTTAIGSGTALKIGNGGSIGSIAGNVTNNGTLAFNRSNAANFAGAISGTGVLLQQSPGTLTLDGNSSAFTGTSTVQDGTLVIGGAASNGATLGGDVSVNSGATLGGHGSIGGSVVVASGAHLAPGNSIGTLTIGGDLTLAQNSVLNYEFGAPAATPNTFTAFGAGDSVAVGGNLQLDGATLNVADAGGFGPGLYNLFTYGGTLAETNGGMTLGSAPAGAQLQIQKLTAQGQINLINSTGLTLDFWNGNGLASAIQMGGGDGIWSTTAPNWTDATGTLTAAMQPQPGFAVFGGAAGTVTVDDHSGADPVSALGMQFASNGYTLNGDTLTLIGSGGAAPIVRVGDGSAASAAYTTTINNVLAGNDGLIKADLGTLVLTGNNTYSGNTTINGGTLEANNNSALSTGTVTVDNSANQNATLKVDAGIALTNYVVLNNGAVLENAGSIIHTATNSAVDSIVGSGSVNNYAGGSIVGSRFGVRLFNDGNLTNAGTISSSALSGAGVAIYGAAGSVSNLGGGSISNTNGGAGVALVRGGTVNNDGVGSTITASASTPGIGWGIQTTSAVATVHNMGGATIHGDHAGVVLLAGGEVENGAGSTISGNQYSVAIGVSLSGFTGSGAGILRNAGTLTGDVLLDATAANTVELTAGGSLAGNLAIGSNTASTLLLDGSNSTPQLYSDAVTGSTTFAGALSKDDSGTWIIDSNDLSSVSSTNISAGTLQIGNGGSSGSIGNGNVVNNGSLTFNRSDDLSFGGALSGTGTLTQAGTGTLTLDGNSSTFTGTTTVQSGTLQVGDADTPTAFLGGNVDVATDGTLRGHGTIGGNVVNAGTLWPGGSIGTLTVQGNYTQAVGSAFNVDATPAGEASLLTVGGTASILGGTTVVLAQAGTWAPRTDYTILTAAGGVTGHFDTATSSLAFLNAVLTYTTNAVNLSLQRNDINFNAVAQTPNQHAVATAANPLGFGNPLYDVLVNLDAPTAQRAFNQLSGEIHASTASALVDDSRYVRDAINQHLLGANNGSEGSTDHGTNVWASAWGHGGHYDSDGNAALLQANGSGLLVGADLAVGSSTRLGVVLGHGQNSTQANNVSSSAHVRSDHIGLYAASTFGPFALRAGAVYASQDVSTHRAVAFGTYHDWLTSKHDAQTTQAYVEGGYQFNVSPGQQLEPFLNIARVRVHNDAVQESGGAAALAVAGNSMSVNTATLGLRDTLALDAAGGIHAHASIGWQKAWGDLTPLSTMRFVSGGDNFAIAGVPVAKHAVTTNIGVNFTLAKNVTVDASYLGQFGNGVKDQGARMTLTVAF